MKVYKEYTSVLKGSHGKMYTLFQIMQMCGIIGFTGHKNAVPVLLDALTALEYRGYDSSGISVFADGGITTVKSPGRIFENAKKIKQQYSELYSECGIGHTRWATHGEPSEINSHPHSTENVSVVHNGIIENYVMIRDKMRKNGFEFVSETDTEAALALIDYYYNEYKNPLEAINKAVSELYGSYALGILFRDFPGTVYAVKKDSPLICSLGSDGGFIASDIIALPRDVCNIYRLCDGETAVVTENDIHFYNGSGLEIIKHAENVKNENEVTGKDGIPHFMLKEIYEEPDVILKTVSSYLAEGIPVFSASALSREKVAKCKRIHIVACGTAMHAGLIGKYYIEKHSHIPVNVDIASEFRYGNPILDKDDIFIAVTQSGETADTLAALRHAKAMGLLTVSVVNVRNSTVANESDGVIYTLAGTEIAVASTKAYSVQSCTFYILSLLLAMYNGSLATDIIRKKCSALIESIPDTFARIFMLSEKIKEISYDIAGCENLFFIGRNIDYSLSLEASLKLKEISYIHSEAYAAGEMKHGTISLIKKGTPVIAVITEKKLVDKTLNNIKEVKARGADVYLICDESIDIPEEIYEKAIMVPHLSDNLTFLTAAAAFQLLAYHTADIRKCDIDKPRNLAKSVTVE